MPPPDAIELYFEGALAHPPLRSIEEVAKCLGWVYEGREEGWHILSASLDIPLLKAPRIFIKEGAPGRFVGRGVVPAGELTFEILIEKSGDRYRWLFRGVQRGAINILGKHLFETLARRMAERVAACL